eukprot:gene15304-16881_t
MNSVPANNDANGSTYNMASPHSSQQYPPIMVGENLANESMFNNIEDKDRLARQQATERRYQSMVNALESAGILDLTLKTSELEQKNDAFEKDLTIFEEIVKATQNAIKDNKQ